MKFSQKILVHPNCTIHGTMLAACTTKESELKIIPTNFSHGTIRHDLITVQLAMGWEEIMYPLLKHDLLSTY